MNTVGVCRTGTCSVLCADGWMDADAAPGCETPCAEAGADCATGLIGECSAGVVQCVGTDTECVQLSWPRDEVCDLRDNDCDGETNEGLAGCCPTGAEACGAGCCIPPQRCCGSACADLSSDMAHCGDCTTACDGQVSDRCVDGSCRCGSIASCRARGLVVPCLVDATTGPAICCSGACRPVTEADCSSCGTACTGGTCTGVEVFGRCLFACE
jgi:hypothetical protein